MLTSSSVLKKKTEMVAGIVRRVYLEEGSKITVNVDGESMPTATAKPKMILRSCAARWKGWFR